VSPAAAFRIVEIAGSDPRYEDARELRYAALYASLGLPRTLVEDPAGHEYVHLAAVDDRERLIGYARLLLEDGRADVFQVAVVRDRRGSGVGTALMSAAVDRARSAGCREVVLDARVPVIGFYERLGFVEKARRSCP
jgi:ribosomal protein S18 acetylase RimI-like enzyme